MRWTVRRVVVSGEEYCLGKERCAVLVQAVVTSLLYFLCE